MADLPCRIIAQVAFKAGGDVFHELMAKRPHHVANVTPAKVQACHLHEGSYGLMDQLSSGNTPWVHGKKHTAKQVLQDIDEAKKQITFKMLEGDLLKLYKNMAITIHVETKAGVDFITWTIEYQLLKADNPHPLSLLNFFIEFTKEVESHFG